MIFTTLFLLLDKKFLQKVLKTTIWKRRERLFQKMFAPIRKQHIAFRKLVRKKFNKIALANATCFQWDLENHVKARQTNENSITHKQMLAATLSIPVVVLLMSECSIFVFAVIVPVLTNWFSIASPDAQILARKVLFQQQYLKTPFWMNDPQRVCWRTWYSLLRTAILYHANVYTSTQLY